MTQGTSSEVRFPLGNGGQNIKISIADDGAKVSAIDVHGAWRLNVGATHWVDMFGGSNLPSGVKTPGNTWLGFTGGTTL